MKINLAFILAVLVIIVLAPACAPLAPVENEITITHFDRVLDNPQTNINSNIEGGRYELWCYKHSESWYFVQEGTYQGYQVTIVYLPGDPFVEVTLVKTETEGTIYVDARVDVWLSDSTLTNEYYLDSNPQAEADLLVYIATLNLQGIIEGVELEQGTIHQDYTCQR